MEKTTDSVFQSIDRPATELNAQLAQTSADYYFDSYSHFGIHEEMLKDEVRTKSYMNAIEQNKHLFKGKVVLDVGCGTGILSMFAARAGAARVYAVECSSIVNQARQIIEDNGFADKITVIQGKMEEITLPEQVDIIISEWMGYFLLYESMLDTVLYARDKYLVPGGIILPDKAVLYMCAIEDEEYKHDKIDFWDDVYGFNMRVIKEMALTEPLVDTVEGSAVLSTAVPILQLDILTCTKEIHKPIVFSTAPNAKYTHWKQTVFYLTNPLTVCSGEVISGHITCDQNSKNPRDLDITIKYNFEGQKMTCDCSQFFRLR